MATAEARGRVGRALLAEDARWAVDAALSTRNSGAGSAVALLLTHHFVRIAYEGALAIQSPDPNVGRPQLATLLDDEYPALTARARHVSKVLDDNRKTPDEVLSELARVHEHNRHVFRTDSHSIFRRLRSDLGLFLIDDRVVGASIPIAYRLGLDPGNSNLMSGESLRGVTREWGSTIAVLASADFQPPIENGTHYIDDKRLRTQDKVASRWLSDRFDRGFSLEAKLLLLMIEGDLNCSRSFLPMVEQGHEMTVFRARVVTLYHSLTALNRLIDSHGLQASHHVQRVRNLLADPVTQGLLSKNGKQVRNRCVHYELKDARLVPNAALPMFGLVEAVYPGATWAGYDRDVRLVTDRLAELLWAWKP